MSKPQQLDQLSNQRLLDLIKFHCTNKDAAYELERRWKGFWHRAKLKTNCDPDDLQEEILWYGRSKKEAEDAIYRSELRKAKIEKSIRATKQKIATLQEHDYYKLKRKLQGQKAATSNLQGQVATLKRQIEKAKTVLAVYQQNKMCFDIAVEATRKAQQDLIRENLHRIERDLRFLVLDESGIFDFNASASAASQ